MIDYPLYIWLDSIWENFVENIACTSSWEHKWLPVFWELCVWCPLLLRNGSFPSFRWSPHHVLRDTREVNLQGSSFFSGTLTTNSSCLSSMTFTLSLHLREIGSTWDLSLHSSLKILSRQETGATKGSFLGGVSSLRGHCSVLLVIQCLKPIVSYILSSV